MTSGYIAADDWEIEEIRHMAKMPDLAHSFSTT